ncbi:MAG: glycosyltransferase [Bacteroidetes bacterium]|nr:glycosyltransferase [Bacteroidota bacterium]
MTFASDYLSKGALFPPFTLPEPPDAGLGIIVVIPAYDEPEINNCITSLAACIPPGTGTEVIIVVNSPAQSGRDGTSANKRTIGAIREWQRTAGEQFFRLFVLDAGQPGIKGWGVGAARKTGMDEAVRRFEVVNNPDGVILSLDADCTVSENYLATVWEQFGKNRKAGGCSIGFRHRDDEPETDRQQISAVKQYELHLRYFVAGLRYSTFPYSYHTVGSAFAVRAARYVKAGGMCRKQGGEDFYFIRKLVTSDDFIEIKPELVFPSARISARVPFGTGPSLDRLLQSGCKDLLTYSPQSFVVLRELFCLVRSEVYSGTSGFPDYTALPVAVKSFMDKEIWVSRTAEVISNTSDRQNRLKRFYSWFNAFMIVKFLNRSHENTFKKVPVVLAAREFLMLSGEMPWPALADMETLLSYFRAVDSR